MVMLPFNPFNSEAVWCSWQDCSNSSQATGRPQVTNICSTVQSYRGVEWIVLKASSQKYCCCSAPLGHVIRSDFGYLITTHAYNLKGASAPPPTYFLPLFPHLAPCPLAWASLISSCLVKDLGWGCLVSSKARKWCKSGQQGLSITGGLGFYAMLQCQTDVAAAHRFLQPQSHCGPRILWACCSTRQVVVELKGRQILTLEEPRLREEQIWQWLGLIGFLAIDQCDSINNGNEECWNFYH